MTRENTAMLPMMDREALVRADTYDEENRTVDIIWTTGATVRRRGFFSEDYDEELEVSSKAIRLDRLNNGAPFLNAHNAFELSGQIGVVAQNSARIVNGQGVAKIKFSKRADVEPILQDIRDGIIRNVSVGYRVHRYEIEKRDGEPELRRAVDWEPLEISAVPIGADPGARVRKDDAETYPCIVSRNDAPAAKTANHGEANMPDGNQPGAAATLTRAELIDDLAKRHNLDDKFVNELKAKKGDIAETREAVLEELFRRDEEDAGGHTQLSEQGMTSRSLENPDFRQNAMAGAIVHRMMPSAKNLPEGWQAYRGWSFVDLAAECLERDGVRTRGMRPGQIVQAALGNNRSMHTRASAGYGATGSGDFIGTIGDAGRQFMLERYRLAEPVLKTVAREMSFTDYRDHQSIRGSGFPKLDEVNEHGEIKQGHLEDAGEKMKLVRYAKRVGLTHHALINDKVGQFADLMSNAAETAIAQESTLLAEKIEENPALADGEDVFSAAHNNLASSGAAPDETTAAAMRTALRQQLGLNNQLIAPTPKFLLVPTDLETKAEKLVAQITPAKTDDANVFTTLTPLVEPRLTDQFAWYLAADPAQTEGLRYGYLESEGGPVVDERYGWEIEGIEVRVRLSFAAGWVDFRGWQKNPGQ